MFKDLFGCKRCSVPSALVSFEGSISFTLIWFFLLLCWKGINLIWKGFKHFKKEISILFFINEIKKAKKNESNLNEKLDNKGLKKIETIFTIISTKILYS